MTTHTITSFDSHRMIYNNNNKNQTYIRTIYSSTSDLSFHPIPSIDICENLLHDSRTTSSYLHHSEHYDNACTHTYDNPLEYLANYDIEGKLINHSYSLTENLYDNAKSEEISVDGNPYASSTPHSTSPILFYFKNRSLALYACLISLALLLLIGLGLFLLNKFLRPVPPASAIHHHHHHHYNLTNTSTTPRTNTSSAFVLLSAQLSNDMPLTKEKTLSCPPNFWGSDCKSICKPCGMGICHFVTGQCICPEGIYGEFCDLWKVNDQPKRGDMIS